MQAWEHRLEQDGGAALRKIQRLRRDYDASAHGSPAQRIYGEACAAYEADPVSFAAQAEAEETAQLAAEKAAKAAALGISVVK